MNHARVLAEAAVVAMPIRKLCDEYTAASCPALVSNHRMINVRFDGAGA